MSAAPSAAAPAPAPPPTLRTPEAPVGRVLVPLVLAVLSYAMMQTMLVPTLGVLQRELHTTPAGASWAVLSAPLLTSAVLTPIAGRLGDSHGKRRTLVGVLLLYLVGTVGCAASPSIGALIAFRAVQGASLAVLPLSFALIRETLPAERVGFGLGLTSGLVGGAAGVGLLCGGLITDHTSWRWLFVAGAALIVAALALVRGVPADRPGRRERIDLPGAALFGLSLVALLLGLTEGPGWGWASARVLGLFGASVVLFAVFTLYERAVAEPLVDIRLLAHRPILLTHLAALALGANQFVFYVLVPKLAELPNGLPPQAAGAVGYGFGTSVTGAGLVMVPGTLLGLAASSVAGRISARRGPRAVLLLGLSVAAAGAALLAALHANAGQVTVVYGLVGIGSGFAMAALPALIHDATSAAQNATANGVNTVARTVGGAVGSQLGTAILTTWTVSGTALPAEHGFTVAFGVGAVAAALGALLAPWTHAARRGPAGGSGGRPAAVPEQA